MNTTTPQADLPTARALRRKTERQRIYRLMAYWVLGPTAAAAIYYIAIAPPEYRTITEITIRGPQSPQTTTLLSGLGLGGLGGAGTSADPHLVVDYLQSPATIDMLRRNFGFNQAYDRLSLDPFGHLADNAPVEAARDYWKRKLRVSYDSGANTITLEVKAFTPQDSVRLTQGAVAAASQMEQGLNTQVQLASLALAKEQLAAAKRDYDASTQRLSQLTGKETTLTMDTQAKEAEVLVAAIDPQLAQLKVNLASQTAAYRPDAPQVKATLAQIETLQKERDRAVGAAKMAPGSAAAAHDVLIQAAQQDYQFFQKSYFAAAAAVVTAQPEHANQSFVIAFVPPHIPQRSDYWSRLLNVIAVFLGASMLFGIGSISYSVIKDHVQ